MHKTTLYLDERARRRLRQLAEASGRTQAAVIRDAIERYVAGAETRRPRSVGLGAGAPDLGARAEEHLAGMGAER
jgi:predicted transcriptional regulator